MFRHIMIGQGAQERETADLTRRLKGIQINYRFGIMDKKRAQLVGARVIDDHYKTMIRLTRGRLGYALKRPVSLSPEDQRRLDRWRDEAIEDWNTISAGITRVRWATRGDERVCPICGPLEGRIYRKGQFLPPLPAHANCRCGWELMFDPAEIPSYVA